MSDPRWRRIEDICHGALEREPEERDTSVRTAIRVRPGQTVSNYDVSPDGQRFVMVKGESGSSRLNVVLNGFD